MTEEQAKERLQKHLGNEYTVLDCWWESDEVFAIHVLETKYLNDAFVLPDSYGVMKKDGAIIAGQALIGMVESAIKD